MVVLPLLKILSENASFNNRQRFEVYFTDAKSFLKAEEFSRS
jgi:hypothetical protein